MAKIGFWDLPSLDTVATAPPRAAEIMGLGPKDPTYTPAQYMEWVVPEDRAAVLEEIARSRAKGDTYDSVHRFRLPSGEIRWFHRRGHFKRTDDGILLHVQGIVVDITLEKEAEESFKRSRGELDIEVSERTADLQKALNGVRVAEKHLRELVDALPVMIWTANQRGEFTYQNQCWYDYLQPDCSEAREKV
jgi:PAS domain S-box-containing protein